MAGPQSPPIGRCRIHVKKENVLQTVPQPEFRRVPKMGVLPSQILHSSGHTNEDVSKTTVFE